MQKLSQKHPWAILAAGAAIQVLTGLPAAWGVFQQPVMEEYGLSEQGAGYAFGILIAAFGVGCVIGGFLQDRKGPAARRSGARPCSAAGSLRRPFCRGRRVAFFLWGVQHPGGAGHGVLVPVHPVLRPEVVQGPEGPCHRRHRRGGGTFRCVPDRLCPNGAQGLRAGAGHPGGFLGAGGADAAGLLWGQHAAGGPAARKAEAGTAGQKAKRLRRWIWPLCRCSAPSNTGSAPGQSAFPPRRCCCSAPSS